MRERKREETGARDEGRETGEIQQHHNVTANDSASTAEQFASLSVLHIYYVILHISLGAL